jgi:hypothetical protein
MCIHVLNFVVNFLNQENYLKIFVFTSENKKPFSIHVRNVIKFSSNIYLKSVFTSQKKSPSIHINSIIKFPSNHYDLRHEKSDGSESGQGFFICT